MSKAQQILLFLKMLCNECKFYLFSVSRQLFFRHYMAKSMWTHLLINELYYFSYSRCQQVYKMKHKSMQSA